MDGSNEWLMYSLFSFQLSLDEKRTSWTCLTGHGDEIQKKQTEISQPVCPGGDSAVSGLSVNYPSTENNMFYTEVT